MNITNTPPFIKSYRSSYVNNNGNIDLQSIEINLQKNKGQIKKNNNGNVEISNIPRCQIKKYFDSAEIRPFQYTIYPAYNKSFEFFPYNNISDTQFLNFFNKNRMYNLFFVVFIVFIVGFFIGKYKYDL